MSDSMSVEAKFIAKDGISSTVSKIKSGMQGLAETPKKVTAGFGTMLKGAGVFKVVSAGVSAVKSSLGGAISRIDTLNNSNRVFENMGFSAQKTSAMMQALQGSIKGLPTPMNDAVQGVQLIASSTDDLGKSQKIWSALNDGIIGFGGTTGQVSNAVTQLSQAFSNGKIDAQTWNSMIQSGLGPALSSIAKQMHMTTGELKDGLSEGDISVSKFQDALIKLDTEGGGGLKSLQTIVRGATGGISTSIQNAKTAVVRGTGEIIKSTSNVMKEVTGFNLAETISKIGDLAESTLQNIAKRMSGLVDKIKPYIEILKTAFTEIGPPVKEAFNAIIASYKDLYATSAQASNLNGFKSIMNSIVGVIKKVSGFIQDNSDKIAYLISQLPKLAAGWLVFNKVAPLIKPATDGISKLKNVFTDALTANKKFGSTLVNVSSSAFSSVTGKLGVFKTKFSGIFSSLVEDVGMNKFRATFSTLDAMIVGLFPNLDRLSANFQDIKRQMKSLGEGNLFTRPFKSLNGALMTTFPKLNQFSQVILHPVSSLKKLGMVTSESGLQVFSMSKLFSKGFTGIGTAIKSMATTGIAGIKALGAALLSNPIGIAIGLITVAIVGLVAAWKSNFQNIRGFTSSFLSGIKNSFTSLSGMVSNVKESFAGLGPVISVLKNILTGAFLFAIKTVSLAIAALVDALRGVVMVISDVVIAFSTLLKMIAKGGSAISKVFRGDFTGAAKDAKAAVSSVGEGIGQMGKNLTNFGKNSAIKSTIGSFNQLGNKTDETGAKVNALAASWKKSFNSVNSDTEDVKTNLEEAGQVLESTFSDKKSKAYVTSSINLMKSFTDERQKITDQANAVMKAAEGKSAESQRQARIKAANIMLQDQTQANKSLVTIMNDNSNMLKANKTKEGQALNDEQRKALENQNTVIRQSLAKQYQMQIDAANQKIANGRALSKAEQDQLVTNLGNQLQVEKQTIESNNQQINELKAKYRAASSQTEQLNYQQQIDNLKANNQEQLDLINKNQIDQLQLLISNGQVNNQQLLANLQNAGQITQQQMMGLMGTMNKSNSDMSQKMLLLAQTMKSGGVSGANDLVTALQNKDYEAVGYSINAGIENSLGTLPDKMFKKGAAGRDNFIESLKKGDVTGAAKYLSDSAELGASTTKNKLGKEGKKGVTEYNKYITNGKPDAKKAGQALGGSTVSGIKSTKKDVSGAAKSAATSYATAIESKKPTVKKAGKSLAASAVSGAKTKISAMTSVGKQIAAGLATGISSNSGVVSDAAAGAVSKAVAAAKKKAKIKSPSRLFRDEVGRYLALGMAVGIRDNTSEAEQAAQDMIDGVQQQVSQSAIATSALFKGEANVQVGGDIGLMNTLSTIIDVLREGKQIVLDDGTLIGATAGGYDQELGNLTSKRGRYEF